MITKSQTNTQKETRLQKKVVTPTNKRQIVVPEDGYQGFSKVTVEPIPGKYVIPAGTINIDFNGMASVKGFEFANIDVQPLLQSKGIIPLSSTQTITPDMGYYGLGSVEVAAIPSDYIVPKGTLGVKTNGVQDVSGYQSINVDVQPKLQTKTITPTHVGQTIKADTNYDGLSDVKIDPIPSKYIVPSGSATITQNGSVDVTCLSSVTIDVKPSLQSKDVVPISTMQRVVADSGYDGMMQVTVGAIPSDYIIPSGSATITKNGTSNVKSLSEVVVDVKPKLQDKTVTPSKVKQCILGDAGYDGLAQVWIEKIPENYIVPSGTQVITDNGVADVTSYAKVSVNVKPALQIKTVTPTAVTQRIKPDDAHDGFSEVIVGAIPKTYIIPTGTQSVTSNGTYDIQGSASVKVDVHPSLQEVTITPDIAKKIVKPDEMYDGISQITVNAIPSEYQNTTDATATSDDIVVGKTAYINGGKIVGTKTFQTYYTGSEIPPTSLGNDGDIYLQG